MYQQIGKGGKVGVGGELVGVEGGVSRGVGERWVVKGEGENVKIRFFK